MKLPKIMIFDVGGTLINGSRFENVDLGYKYLYDEVLDVKESYQDYTNFINELIKIIPEREKGSLEFSFRSLFNYLSLVYGLKTHLGYEQIEEMFISKFYQYEMIDHVKTLLDYLKKQGVRMAVFSNSMYSSCQIKRELASVGILTYFESVVSSADYLVRKPSRHVFTLYLKKYGIMGYKSDAIGYIGNMFKYDIEPVLPLKMVSILKSDHFEQHNDYLEISNYLELIEEFKRDEE